MSDPVSQPLSSEGRKDGTWKAANYGSAQWINNATGGPDYQSGVRVRTYQWRYRAPRHRPIRRLKALLANASCPNGQGETPGPNIIGVRASVVTGRGIDRLRFSADPTARIAPGHMAESDALEVDIAADAHYLVRVCVEVEPGGVWPIGPVFLAGAGQGFVDDDRTGGGAVPAIDGSGYCPAAILIDADIRSIAGVGDSLMHGWGDCFSTDADGNIGWLGRMAMNRCGQLKLAASGSRADQFRPDGLAMGLLRHADVIVEAFGRNDIPAGHSAARILADREAIWKAIRRAHPHKRLLAATIVPVNIGNRPIVGSEVRNSVNDGLAPHVGGLIDGLVDICPPIETHPRSNIFKAGMSGRGGDWTHLSPEGYAAVADYIVGRRPPGTVSGRRRPRR